MAKQRYRDNPALDWSILDGKKLTMQVSSGYIVGVEPDGTPHVLLVGVHARKEKEVPIDGQPDVQPMHA